MSDIRYCYSGYHDFIREFIELYKSLPCLWKVKSQDYNDRNKKNKAYSVLIEKFKEVDSNATRDTVTKKINCLRSAFRKEVIKVRRAEQNGEDYRPNLWYYDLLDFLTNQDLPKELKRTFDDSDASFTESKWDYLKPIMETERLDDENSTETARSTQSSEYDNKRGAYTTSSEVSKGTKRSASEEAFSNSKVIQLAAEKLRHTNDICIDRNVSFGRYVTDELNTMPCEMVNYVKKLINLAIYEGNMKTLNETSSINTFRSQQKPGNSSSGETSSSTELCSECIKKLQEH